MYPPPAVLLSKTKTRGKTWGLKGGTYYGLGNEEPFITNY